MKKLLVAASMAAGLAAGAVPAFAQSATTNPPGRFATADSGAAGLVRSQNYNQAPAPMSDGAHVGDGSRPDFLMHQQELRNLPGYSPDGTD